MKTPYIFEKEFDDLKAAWKFLNYLSSHIKEDLEEDLDLRLELQNTSVRVSLKEKSKIFDELIENYFEPKADPRQNARLFCDGGSRGNPGPGACGFVILDENDQVITQGGRFFKHCTNNQAEYWSLREGVSAALKQNIQNLDIYMDSQLIVRQIKGEYRVKNENLLPIYEGTKLDLDKLETYEITHIPRRHNKLADSLVNQILDQNL